MEQQPLKKSALLWYSFGLTLYFACQWVLSIVVVRFSGYADAGDLSIAMSFSNVFATLAMFGVRNHQVADLRDELSPSTYVTGRVVTTAAAYLGLTVLVLCSGYARGTALVILLYCLFRVAEIMTDVFHGIDQKGGRLDAVGKSNTMRGLGFAAAFTAALCLGAPLPAALLAMSLVVAPMVLFYDLPLARRLAPFRLVWDGPQLRVLLRVCAPLMGYILLFNTMCFVPRWFLERLCGNEALGFYASVANPTLIVQMAATYLFNPMIPAFSAALLERDERTFSRLFGKICALLGLLAAAALVLGRLLGPFLLSLLFGEEILPYAYLLDAAILCTIFTAFVWFLCALLTVFRDGAGLLAATALSLVVSLLASTPLIGRFSLLGTSYSLLLALSVALAVLFWRYSVGKKRLFRG